MNLDAPTSRAIVEPRSEVTEHPTGDRDVERRAVERWKIACVAHLEARVRVALDRVASDREHRRLTLETDVRGRVRREEACQSTRADADLENARPVEGGDVPKRGEEMAVGILGGHHRVVVGGPLPVDVRVVGHGADVPRPLPAGALGATTLGVSHGASITASDLWSRSVEELRATMATLHPVRADDVAGFAYRGVSLGLPRLVERLTWKTFMKAFVRDGARVRGFNVRVHQDELDPRQPPSVRPREKGGVPVHFGHFLARETPEELVLDYGAYASRLDPMQGLRDPVRALHPNDPTVLLGMSWVDVLGRRIDTPSWFTLERVGPAPSVPAPVERRADR